MKQVGKPYSERAAKEPRGKPDGGLPRMAALPRHVCPGAGCVSS